MDFSQLDEETLALLNQVGQLYEDGLREQMQIDKDWRYVSTRTTKNLLAELIALAGEENIRFVVVSEYKSKEPENNSVRFTAFFSPQAVANLTEYMNNEKQKS